jgi:hypothetical protein
MSNQPDVLWARVGLRLGDRVVIENTNLKKFNLLKYDIWSIQWT